MLAAGAELGEDASAANYVSSPSAATARYQAVLQGVRFWNITGTAVSATVSSVTVQVRSSALARHAGQHGSRCGG